MSPLGEAAALLQPDPAAAAPAASPRTKTTKGERTREAIMAAATDLFRERGFRETSLGDIGAAAGVSGPAIYRYFDSKGELLSVLIEEAAIMWRGTVDDVLNEDMPPMATLELLIDAAIVLQLRNGNLRDVFVKEYRSLMTMRGGGWPGSSGCVWPSGCTSSARSDPAWARTRRGRP